MRAVPICAQLRRRANGRPLHHGDDDAEAHDGREDDDPPHDHTRDDDRAAAAGDHDDRDHDFGATADDDLGAADDDDSDCDDHDDHDPDDDERLAQPHAAAPILRSGAGAPSWRARASVFQTCQRSVTRPSAS